MHKIYLTRIVTFLGYPDLTDANPQEILSKGSRTITLSGKQRYFTVRKVFYDESMTPMFSIPEFREPLYHSLEELKENIPHHSPIFDSPILDNNHSLKIWNNETQTDYSR